MAKRRKNKEIEFIMETDWIFEKPIDQEHKEYKLLSYFQKMGEKLDNMELYPGFIELSLHLANIQTLIKQKQIIYTDKKFNSIDDELLVRDLKIKPLPEMTQHELQEFAKILTYSTPRLLEYFNVAKSVWTLAYDTVNISLKKNKNNLNSKTGYFYYSEKKNNILYVWEYHIKPMFRGSDEEKTLVNLIYSEPKGDLTIPKIINTFSQWNEDDKRSSLPLFEMTSNDVFPINETLLPLFKRKLINYINQRVKLKSNENKN
jgi:hypothetical protein